MNSPEINKQIERQIRDCPAREEDKVYYNCVHYINDRCDCKQRSKFEANLENLYKILNREEKTQ